MERGKGQGRGQGRGQGLEEELRLVGEGSRTVGGVTGGCRVAGGGLGGLHSSRRATGGCIVAWGAMVGYGGLYSIMEGLWWAV